MSPYLEPSIFPLSDIVIYRKFVLPKEDLTNKIVAMRNPFNPKEIMFRRVIATEH